METLHPGAGSGGEGGYGGGAALVAEIVEVDAVLAGGLGHLGEVEAGVLLLHREDEVVGEVFDRRPVVFGFDGDDDVEAFAAGGLEEGFEAEFFRGVRGLRAALRRGWARGWRRRGRGR